LSDEYFSEEGEEDDDDSNVGETTSSKRFKSTEGLPVNKSSYVKKKQMILSSSRLLASRVKTIQL